MDEVKNNKKKSHLDGLEIFKFKHSAMNCGKILFELNYLINHYKHMKFGKR